MIAKRVDGEERYSGCPEVVNLSIQVKTMLLLGDSIDKTKTAAYTRMSLSAISVTVSRLYFNFAYHNFTSLNCIPTLGGSWDSLNLGNCAIIRQGSLSRPGYSSLSTSNIAQLALHHWFGKWIDWFRGDTSESPSGTVHGWVSWVWRREDIFKNKFLIFHAGIRAW